MSDRTERVPTTVSGGVYTYTLEGRVFADREGAVPLALNEDGSFTAPEGGQLVWVDTRP